MKLCILVVLFFFISPKAFSQEICMPLDSIKVFILPWEMDTKIPLSENDVRQFEFPDLMKKINPKWEKKVMTITERNILNDFVKINLADSTILFNKGDIDVRVVFDLYLQKSIISLSISKRILYTYLGRCYLNNKMLNQWINKYLSDYM